MTQVVVRPQKSTIVLMFSAPWPVRAAFGVLDRVAPAVGARWAERIWFTLPTPRPRRPDEPVAKGGEPFTVTLTGLPEIL